MVHEVLPHGIENAARQFDIYQSLCIDSGKNFMPPSRMLNFKMV
jgi:hypothetical protein